MSSKQSVFILIRVNSFPTAAQFIGSRLGKFAHFYAKCLCTLYKRTVYLLSSYVHNLVAREPSEHQEEGKCELCV